VIEAPAVTWMWCSAHNRTRNRAGFLLGVARGTVAKTSLLVRCPDGSRTGRAKSAGAPTAKRRPRATGLLTLCATAGMKGLSCIRPADAHRGSATGARQRVRKGSAGQSLTRYPRARVPDV
jgi:hypothetical protein